MPAPSVTIVIPEYRDGMRAALLVEVLRAQTVDTKHAIEIVVVDDGSDDDSVDRLRRDAGHAATIVALPRNMGRSEARNAGAGIARGEILVFMDADCLPATSDFIEAHVSRYNGDIIAVAGAVSGADGTFWDRYQQDASTRRRWLHDAGHRYTGSTQNFSVLRASFLAIGGFDKRYRQYGFEDRDLLVRLDALGRIEWDERARVRHLDPLSLRGVLAKMCLAGKHTAGLFSSSHPAAYRALGYAAIDARLHRWLIAPARIVGPLLPFLALLIEPLLQFRLLYPLTRRMVKAASAAAFMHGTTLASLPPVEESG